MNQLIFFTVCPNPIKPVLTPSFVAQTLNLENFYPKVTGGPLGIESDIPFTQISTDTRSLIPGSLYVALKGEKFDGHHYIDAALSAGAKGILYTEGTPIPPSQNTKNVSLFPVKDSLNGYRKLAGAWRKLFSIPVIAVAGSAGKTTTKELLAAILQGKWKNVLKTQGSQNGFVGIPMTLLQLNAEHSAVVVEVGIDDVGAMQQHMELVQATHSILTAIGPEHMHQLKDLPTIAAEEGIALTYVSQTGGKVIIHLDDPWISSLESRVSKDRSLSFSLQPGSSAHLHGEIINQGKDLKVQHTSTFTLPLPLLGSHNAANLLGATTMAISLGLTPEEVQKGIRFFQGAEGRSQVKTLPGPVTVICDYYNAQPASVAAGLKLLSEIATQTKWACLGDMLELGADEEKMHRDLATQIIQLNIDKTLLFGPRMESLRNELENRGYQGYCAHFATHSDLAQMLLKTVQSGDTLLIKGSRGMRMEEIWKILEAKLKT